MRILLAGFVVLMAAIIQPASAQDYPWCAVYDMEGSVTNCGFVSLEQCRWTISGIGGHCEQNPFVAASIGPRNQPRKKKRSDR